MEVSDLPQAGRRAGWGATDGGPAPYAVPPGQGGGAGGSSPRFKAAPLTAGSPAHEFFLTFREGSSVGLERPREGRLLLRRQGDGRRDATAAERQEEAEGAEAEGERRSEP